MFPAVTFLRLTAFFGYNNRGNVLAKQKRFDDALASYVRAIALKPDYAEAHNNLGNVQKALGQLDEAAASYRKALEVWPDNAMLHNNLGMVQKALGQREAAGSSFHRALELNPGYAEAHNNLGIVQQEQGRLEDAVASYRRALGLKSSYVEAHNNLGVALWDLGKLDEARECFRRAIHLKPDYVQAYRGQFGIFGTLMLAVALGFPLNQAASIGVIGAIDGPTSIFVATKLAPELLAPIAVAAYSYMSLIPIIQPPLMKLLTTKQERRRMEYAPRTISQKALILFPVILTLVAGLLVPEATPLISMLMLGNLLKVSGVVERLSKAAQNEMINITTLFLGLVIGATMSAASFLNMATLKILALGVKEAFDPRSILNPGRMG